MTPESFEWAMDNEILADPEALPERPEPSGAPASSPQYSRLNLLNDESTVKLVEPRMP